ncbi:Oxalate:formate antiporter [Fasciola hepatica]|uniref:Oxalate:formate antiporter n=1 Tax=Fasciola hepatica TaxID=6192 RepID=A0A4E0RYR0_FASHE|nr:Oxalate:formate antiporter [Fasciola hepatica]
MITYSLMKGAGLGLGYSVVLAVATAWFPARRGLIVGMIVGGFGLGALIFTPIQTAFINPKNVKVDNVTRRFTDPELLARVPNVFLMLGGILFTLQVIGFALLRAKPQPKALKTAGDMGTEEEKKRLPEEAVDNRVDASPSTHSLTDSPKGPWSAETPKRGRSDSIKSLREENLTPKQVLRRVDFYLLWFVMFCNIIPITIITSAYKLFGQAFISDDLFLSIVATISALFNSGGRIVWGSFVDRASFKIPLCVMLASWAAILVTFPHLNLATGVTLKVLYAIWVCLLFFSLSGVFAIMPAATGILFGPANLAVNYGLVFNAFAAGSLICGVIATVVQSKDAFLMQFTGCGAVCVAALFTVFWIEDRKMNPRLNICRWCSTRCPSLRAPTASGSVEMRSR